MQCVSAASRATTDLATAECVTERKGPILPEFLRFIIVFYVPANFRNAFDAVDVLTLYQLAIEWEYPAFSQF